MLVNYFCEQETMSVAAGASMLSEFWLAPNLFPIRHRALNSCRQILGHGLWDVLKVKGRAEFASQGHATKRRGRRSVADWCLASGLFLASAARAVVLLEALLGNTVKCERHNGAL